MLQISALPRQRRTSLTRYNLCLFGLALILPVTVCYARVRKLRQHLRPAVCGERSCPVSLSHLQSFQGLFVLVSFVVLLSYGILPAAMTALFCLLISLPIGYFLSVCLVSLSVLFRLRLLRITQLQFFQSVVEGHLRYLHTRVRTFCEVCLSLLPALLLNFVFFRRRLRFIVASTTNTRTPTRCSLMSTATFGI